MISFLSTIVIRKGLESKIVILNITFPFRILMIQDLQVKLGTANGKYKLRVGVSKYKMRARTGKEKLGKKARTKTWSKGHGRAPENMNTHS